MPYDVPGHLLNRLAVVAGDADVVYADAAVDAVDVGIVGGTVCIITNNLVALATLSGSRHAEPPGVPTVRVEAWPRATLHSVEIGDDDQVNNADSVWALAAPGQWPYRSRATLHFDGREKPLNLPLESSAPDAVRVSLARLITDLLHAVP